MEHNFLECAETLTTEEINDIISKLTQIKEERADIARHTAAQKVKDAIAEYLKLGEKIHMEGEVWNDELGNRKNLEVTFNGCFEEGGYLTFLFAE